MGPDARDPLLDAALVGTARQAGVRPSTGTPVDGLVAGTGGDGAERALLLAAGARAVYLRAGRRPRPVQEPLPAPAESVPACSPRAGEIIRRLLTEHSSPLIAEALERLDQAGMRLPFDLLPLALETQRREVRSLLPPVLGERGYWLAEQNPEWMWASGARSPRMETLQEAEEYWQDGKPEQRFAALRMVRSRDAALARRWVEEVWRREQVGPRTMMVKTLEEGLSAEDEDFLETALDDRSATVRLEGARLLARIPESAFTNRMRQRADTVLPVARDSPRGARWRGLVRAVSGHVGLRVDLPEAFPREWQRDGIQPKPPEGLGERAWWLMQLLSFVPPAHWEHRFDAPPADLVASARRHEWGSALIEGFARAAVLHRDAGWAAVLWESWYESQDRNARHDAAAEPWSELLSVLPKREAEELIRRRLSRQAGDLESRLFGALGTLRAPWGVQLGNAYLDALRDHIGRLGPSGASYNNWLHTPGRAALALPPDCFHRALELCDLPEPKDYYMHQWKREMDRFTETVRTRQRIREEIPV